MTDDRKRKFRWWKIPLGILLVLIIAFVGYVAYLLITYYRIEDNLDLEVRGSSEEAVKTEKEYTAVSYNIGFGAYTADFTFFMDGGKESRARSEDSVLECVNGTTDKALSFEPDFVLFQEVDTDSTRSYHVDETELIRNRFDESGTFDNVFAENYHSAYIIVPLYEPHGASNSGLLTMSHADITSSLRRSLPISTGLKKFLDLDRCYSISRIPTENGKELILVNLHLSAYGTDAEQGNAQLEKIFGDLEEEYQKGNYVIAGGDYNHDFTGDSKEYFNPGNEDEYSWCEPFPDSVIPQGFTKCTNYTEGMVATARNTDIPYSEECFTVILDGFIVSDNVECTYIQNVDTGFEYTDHNPVVLKFTLKQ